AQIDVAHGDGAEGGAIYCGIGGILEPVSLLQTVNQAAVEISDVADDAVHLRVGHRLDGDVVAGPVDADAADVGIVVAAGGQRQRQHRGECGNGKALQHG